MGGFLSQGPSAFTTTITAASRVVGTTTHSFTTHSYTYSDITAEGFDAGSDYYAYAAGFGSIADAVYTDGDSNSRTVDSCYWLDNAGGYGNMSNAFTVMFVLDGTSIPNTDATMVKIVIGTDEYLRSAAAYNASVDGGTMWSWDNENPSPFSGATNFQVHVV